MIQEQLILSWRFWMFWALAFLGFPVGGLLANLIAGPVTNIGKAILAGLITGVILGLAQWLVLKTVLGIPAWWIPATSIGLSIGLAVSTAVLGSETSGNELLFRAAITGLCLGLAQWVILRQILPQSEIWIFVLMIGWVVGWFLTRSVGVDLNPKWTVFGAAGAITFQCISGLALYYLTRIPN
jgi:hypothetical protein